MSPEISRPDIPEWARRERQRDLEWIRENFFVLEPAAQAGFAEQGRGAIVVDITSQPVEGLGHPFAYMPQAAMESMHEDTRRIVSGYDPHKEIVLVLLKAQDRTSTYRVQAIEPGGRR